MGVLSTGKAGWKFSQALSRFSHTLTSDLQLIFSAAPHYPSSAFISPPVITNNAFITHVNSRLTSLIRITILHTLSHLNVDSASFYWISLTPTFSSLYRSPQSSYITPQKYFLLINISIAICIGKAYKYAINILLCRINIRANIPVDQSLLIPQNRVSSYIMSLWSPYFCYPPLTLSYRHHDSIIFWMSRHYRKHFIITDEIHLENLLTFQYYSVIMSICQYCKL